MSNKRIEFINRIANVLENKIIKILIDILAVAAIFGIAFYLFGPNLQADWWIVDDHEIAVYTGTDGDFSFKEILPTLLTKTEINPNSTLGRFRPAYYFLRLLETRLWIQHAPMAWYLTRIFIFIFFILAIYFIFKKLNGGIIGVLLAVFCTTPAFWVDIFARLGPSETYAVFGVGLFLFGLLLYLKKKENIFTWICLTLGVLISIGSKENLIIILLPFLFICFLQLRAKNRHKWLAWVSAGICLLWTIWIYLNLFLRIKKMGTDIYSNSVSLGERLSKLGEYFTGNWIVVVSLMLLFGIGLLALLFCKTEKVKLPAKVLMAGSFFTLVLITSQVFFYFGQLDGRYYFPLYLFLPITISLFIYLFQQYALFRNNTVLTIILTIITGIGLLAAINPQNWRAMRTESLKNVQRTQLFMEKVEQITALLNDHPDLGVVFYGTNPVSDYEPIDSYEQFFRAREVGNQFYILRDPPEDYQTSYSKFALRLEEELIGKSINGDPTWTISPIHELSADPEGCVLINLLVDHPSPITCQTVFDGNVFLFYEGQND